MDDQGRIFHTRTGAGATGVSGTPERRTPSGPRDQLRRRSWQTMDVTQHSPKHNGTRMMPFITGLVAGGIIGWLARALMPMRARRGARRQVNPIQVQTYLKGVDYPTGKQGLLERAQAEGADVPVLETLTHLPEQHYTSPIEVSRALGRRKERGSGG